MRALAFGGGERQDVLRDTPKPARQCEEERRVTRPFYCFIREIRAAR